MRSVVRLKDEGRKKQAANGGMSLQGSREAEIPVIELGYNFYVASETEKSGTDSQYS